VDTPAVAGYAASRTTEGTSGEKTVTEAEWLACTDPRKMLEFLRGSSNLSERKARLLAIACCRRVWEWMPDEGKHPVEICEEYADRRVGQKKLSHGGRLT
jgi:hypothetical protein